jgi:hypothetical protein
MRFSMIVMAGVIVAAMAAHAAPQAPSQGGIDAKLFRVDPALAWSLWGGVGSHCRDNYPCHHYHRKTHGFILL